jgi:two-component sensor histidine kinase
LSDVFIKNGIFFLLSLLVLSGYFTLLATPLARAQTGALKPWVLALILSPVLLALPYAHRILGRALDRVWLGRRFLTVDAVRCFLSGTQEAIEESALCVKAERKLSAIFQADAKIVLEPAADRGTPEAVLPIPVHVDGVAGGQIFMGPRTNGTPYFSEDLALLSLLADIFSSLLGNVRLQQKKRLQERAEQELRLVASRAELEALRADINTPFLLKALDTIAGLTHKDRFQAGRTGEALARVLRYTLKRSEKEMVRLEEELDFVRARLDVEKACLGDRLSVQMDIEDGIGDEMVPMMAMHTLVDNAIRHGISAARGAVIIEIRARREGAGLCLEVLDNGPALKPVDSSRDGAGKCSGQGLADLSSRLMAHFGDRAKLTLRRDPADKITVASIHTPVSGGSLDSR